MEALKPCPFCGEAVDLTYRALSGTIACTRCTAEGPCKSNNTRSIAAWNTRTDPQREQLVKALKQIVDAYDNSGKAIDEGMFRVLAAAARAALTAAGEQL